MNQAALRSADISLDSMIPAISKSSNIESALQQSAQLEQWKGVYGTVPAQQSNKAACETFDSEKSDIESGFEQTASTRQIEVEMEEAV
ncbi:hypothetical protein SUGI_1105320 [Cryptomeria japonica]|nr:hypothetical protein SUGI_1105320 [Cryptomeria japonica]